MSEMIKVPDGWEVIEVGKLIKVTTGNKDTVNADSDGIYPFVIRSQDLLKINTYSFDGEAVLIAGDGDIRNIFHYFNGKFDFHQRVYCLHSFKKNLNGKYFYYFFRHNFVNQVNKYSAKGTVDSVRLEMITKMPMNVPPVKEQEKIAKILSTLDKSIEATNSLIEKEKNIKKALMQELLTNGIDKDGYIRSPQAHTYKESELGMIPEEWETISLEKIGNVITGNTPPTDNEEYYNGNIPFIGPVDFVGQKYITKTEKTVSMDGLNYSREIPKDSILTVCIGSTIGKIALAIKQCCTNQQINALVCDKKYFSEFVFYAMGQFLQRQLDVEAGLQAVPIVNKSSFAKLVLPCPFDIDEQKQIAKILTTQDKKIETEETNLAKLKELKKGLMSDLLSGKVRVKV